jgi:hypothetical protein
MLAWQRRGAQGRGDLVDHEVDDGALVLGAGVAVAVRNLLDRIEVGHEVGGVEDGDARVKARELGELRGGLNGLRVGAHLALLRRFAAGPGIAFIPFQIHREALGRLHGLRNPGAFDYQQIESTKFRQPPYFFNKVLTKGAANTSVMHFNYLLLPLD